MCVATCSNARGRTFMTMSDGRVPRREDHPRPADGAAAAHRSGRKSDVMQAALQVEAYTKTDEQGAHLLQLADDADPPSSVTQGRGEADDLHDYDDVVQQS